ncbi:unnamed protein product [Nesidiocoris tenuis]|uniref:Uncharacterized protein n=1 Tax=Nesidiocoris tenuis TaxID=355587 RepID=A0A6H5HMY8_9HEMI|nr:unnamed protein product [Nesidiocoris tenuis]
MFVSARPNTLFNRNSDNAQARSGFLILDQLPPCRRDSLLPFSLSRPADRAARTSMGEAARYDSAVRRRRPIPRTYDPRACSLKLFHVRTCVCFSECQCYVRGFSLPPASLRVGRVALCVGFFRLIG